MSLTADQAVAVLRAAAEPTRLRVLGLLAREELAVLELCRVLGQSQPRVSRHLKLMADAGLVERFPDGAWVFYRLTGAPAVRAMIEAALALVSDSDTVRERDAERLALVGGERARQADLYFAENAARWDEIRSLHTSEADVEAAIVEAAGPGPHRRLVDLGSGSGRMLTLLGGSAKRSVGLDLSRRMLNIARSRIAEAGLVDCELRHGDILKTDLPSAEADLVVVHQVLHFLGDPAAALREAARLMAPGGRLLVVDFAPHDLEFLRTEHRHRRLGFSDAEMERWLAACGLGEVETRTLPAASADGLTVKVWSVDRPREHVRMVA
jgi:ubiquinone/menaquinone biosynthesis C-methylase UbiE/DNA-binding MarR family transcriptional regulator